MEKYDHFKEFFDKPTYDDLASIMLRTDEILTVAEWERIKTEYQFKEGYSRARSANWHRIITGDAVRFAIDVINNGGTAKEIRDACIYVRICVDSEKYSLGYIQFSKDHRLVDIKEKYGLTYRTIK